MTNEGYAHGEIASMGEAIYQDRIRPLVDPSKKGKFVVVDVRSGDYEIDDEDIVATLRLRERRPDAMTFAVKVGYRYAYSIGGGMLEEE